MSQWRSQINTAIWPGKKKINKRFHHMAEIMRQELVALARIYLNLAKKVRSEWWQCHIVLSLRLTWQIPRVNMYYIPWICLCVIQLFLYILTSGSVTFTVSIHYAVSGVSGWGPGSPGLVLDSSGTKCLEKWVFETILRRWKIQLCHSALWPNLIYAIKTKWSF